MVQSKHSQGGPKVFLDTTLAQSTYNPLSTPNMCVQVPSMGWSHHTLSLRENNKFQALVPNDHQQSGLSLVLRGIDFSVVLTYNKLPAHCFIEGMNKNSPHVCQLLQTVIVLGIHIVFTIRITPSQSHSLKIRLPLKISSLGTSIVDGAQKHLGYCIIMYY